jgi:tripartite-type tricarboxylate transporter receptor subunit TctC
VKKILLALSMTLAGALPAWNASAQTFPSKSSRWLVPYPAGGGADFIARTVGQALSTNIGQPVLVDNKPGCNGAVAVSDLVRSQRDGYTLINVDNGTLVFNPVLYKTLGYNPSRDMTLVTLLARAPLVLLAGPGADAKDARDFINKATAQPGKFSYGSAGAGSPQHMGMELLKSVAGLHMVHIPYRGSSPALADLVSGQIPVLMSDYAAASGFIKAGRVRPLAVADAVRHPQLPDVPTFAELGFRGVEAVALVGVAAPSGTPPDVILGLQKIINAALHEPAVSKKFTDFGLEPVGNTPQQFEELIKKDSVRWHKLISDLKTVVSQRFSEERELLRHAIGV